MARRRSNPWGERPSRKRPGNFYVRGEKVYARWMTKTPDHTHVPKHARGVVHMISKLSGAKEARYYVFWEGNPVGGWYDESSLLPGIPLEFDDRDRRRARRGRRR